MGLVGVQCVRGRLTLAEHYDCMQHPDHPCAYTADILDAMTEGNLERETQNVKYSPTSLLGCRRQKVLSRDHEWFMNIDGQWILQRGHMAHAYAETLRPPRGSIGVVRELRLKSSVNTSQGIEWFAGKMDAVVLNKVVVDMDKGAILHVSIIDYKSKGEIGHGPDTHLNNRYLTEGQAAAQRDHQQQINLYAWLVRNEMASWINALTPAHEDYNKLRLRPGTSLIMPIIDEVVVDELIIQYLDFARARRFSSLNTLQSRGKRMPDRKHYETLELLPIFVSSHDYLTRWIIRHIEMEHDAEVSLPPPITGDAAQKFCYRCPVRNICYTIGKEEGYDMAEQMPL